MEIVAVAKIPMPETQRRIPKAPGRPRNLSEEYSVDPEQSIRDGLVETLLNAKAASAVANGQAKAMMLRLVLDTQKAIDAYDRRVAEERATREAEEKQRAAQDNDALQGVMRQMVELMGGAP